MDELFRIAVIRLRGMWNYRWIGLATAWVVGIAAFIAVSLFPERYEASARIFVNTDSILKPLMTGLTVQPNDDQRIAMLSRVVISRPNVERLVQSIGLNTADLTNEQRESTNESVMRRLQFKRASGGENLYTLTFLDVDPNRARQTVEVMTDMFIKSSQGGKAEDTDTAKKFIEEQVAVYDKKLQDAENRLKEFRTRYLGMAPGEGRQDYFARMAETERTLNQARLELREAERSREAYRRGLASAETSAGGSTPGANANLAAELDARIEAQRRNLDTLLQRYTDSHPDVQGARRLIRDLETQRSGLGPVRSEPAGANMGFAGPRASEQLKISLAQSEASVAALSARVGEYAARYETLKASASQVPKLEAELAQLNRDYEVNKRNYETLVSRRESANISGEMQGVAGVGDFRVVDPPRVSPNPVWPTRRLLFPLALLASIAAGLAAAYMARELRPSFYDSRALRDATQLPLLGVVSLNLTEPAIRQSRRRTVGFLGAAGALVAIYAVGFIALEVLLKQFR